MYIQRRQQVSTAALSLLMAPQGFTALAGMNAVEGVRLIAFRVWLDGSLDPENRSDLQLLKTSKGQMWLRAGQA